jgi:hypothetical protein
MDLQAQVSIERAGACANASVASDACGGNSRNVPGKQWFGGYDWTAGVNV